MFVRSFGNNGEELSYFSVGNKNIYIDGAKNAGLNFAKVKKLTGSILAFKNLKMGSPLSSDSVVTFLNTFDSTHYLMLLNASYEPSGTYLTAAAKNKLRQFGSIYCDSIGLLGYFHTWSLIGWLGASHAQVSEMFDPCCNTDITCQACTHWTESVSSMDVTVKRTSGTVSSIIGPAQSWIDLSWVQTLNPNSTVKFDVYGINAANQQTLLFSNLQTNVFSDLSSINAITYPKLNLIAKINIDTATGTNSSILNSVKVNYVAPSEVTWNVNSLKFASSYKVNEDLKFAFDYNNAGYSNIPGVILNIYKKNVYAPNLILTDTNSFTLKPDSAKTYNNRITIPYFRDSIKIIIELKPKGLNNEFYSYNNNIEFSLNSYHLNRPTASIKVFSDNQLLNNGDYVTKHPEIKIDFSNQENIQSLISDTSKLILKLNDSYVPYFVRGKLNSSIKVIDADNLKSETESTLLFYPELSDGKNRLSLVYSLDADNMDTVSYDVFVSDELAVKDLYNYPNPMKDETSFIFNIAGSYAPAKFKIKIYTVSGKLIKQIESAVSIGNNQIQWDGRDDDGDIIANGTYLYKLVTEDDSQSITQTQKLVVLK